jgi:ribosomal-protein-alanine N-acetyltransferase
MVRSDDVLVGTVSASPNAQMGTAELGYQLDQAHHGRGLGTRSVALLVECCFTHPALRRLHATVAVDNHPSRHLLARLGFVHEGTLRAHFLIDGVPTDECVYGLLREEWAVDRARR